MGFQVRVLPRVRSIFPAPDIGIGSNYKIVA